MKYVIEVERTFAGKQYENLKPCLRLEFDESERVQAKADTAQILKDMTNTIEAFGASWQTAVLK